MTVRGAEVPGLGMDVGFVCHGWYPDPGGVESHTRDLARELATRGHRVHVLCLSYDPAREPYSVQDEEVEGVRIRRMAYLYHDHGALADVVRNRKAEDVVMAWLAETPCDLIHVHHVTGFGLGALRAISDVGQPFVMTAHDYWSLCPRGQMLHVDGSVSSEPEPERCADCLRSTWPHLMPSATGRPEGPEGEPLDGDADATRARTAWALEMLALPHRLFTPSGPARAVYERAGVPADRIVVCENGVDVTGLRERVGALRSERADDGKVHLGVLGSVMPSKGALELARAFVAADAPELVLEIHGNLPPYHGDASYVEELQALAAEHDAIHLHGEYSLDELPGILASLDGVAAPSRWAEVYGLTVREARAAGLPVLVSDAGDLAAVAAGGRAGRVLPKEDPAAWQRALEEFARDADQRAAWAAAETPLRSARDMMLQLERAYVEVIREVTNEEPSLVHPLEGQAPELPPAPAKKPGLLRRLFGR